MATLIRWSVFARPASRDRKRLVLPSRWPLVFGCANPANEPLKFDNTSKTNLAKALAVPMLEHIVDALLSDPKAWSTASEDENLAWTARWVAEHLVLWLYGIGTALTWDVQRDQVVTHHQEGRRLRNAFLDAVPYIQELKDTDEPRNHFAPDGSIDLWTALFAWNVFRFRMCDAIETFEASQPLDLIDADIAVAESTAVCESALILATRLREHAALLVVVEAGNMVRASPQTHLPSLAGLLRRSLDEQRPSIPKGKVQTNLLDVLSLTRTVINNMLSFRMLLQKCDQIQDLATLVRCQGLWASSRTLSFTALCCTDNESFFKAVRAFEAAAVEETHAFQRLLASNDVLLASIEEELLEDDGRDVSPSSSPLFKALKRSWLRVGLMLNSQRFEHHLFKNVSERDRLRVESLFDSCLPAALTPTTEGFAAFYNVFLTWCSLQKTAKANDAICAFLRDPDAHEMFQTLLSKSERCNTLLTANKHLLELPCEFSLKHMLRNVSLETMRRMHSSSRQSELEASSFLFFETVQFRVGEMESLVELAKTRGWET